MAKTRSAARPSASAKAASPGPPWSLLLAEGVLLLLVMVVPLATNRNSLNLVDVKDIVLGLGVVLGLSLWLIAGLAQGRLSWVRSRLTLLILLYLGWTGLSVLYSRYRWACVTEYGHLLANAGVFFLALACLRGLVQLRRLGLAVALTFLPVSIYAIAQAWGHDYVKWSSVSASRVFSFLGNPTYLGGYLMLLLPLLVTLLRRGEEEEKLAAGGRLRPLPPAAAAALLALAVLIPCVGATLDLVPQQLLLYAAVAFALMVVYLTFGPKQVPPRGRLGLLLAAIALGLYSLYLSNTIAAYIGLLLGSLVALALVVLRGGRRVLRTAAIAVVVAAVLAAIGGPLAYRHLPPMEQERISNVIHLKDPTATERQLHWKVAAQLFREHPVWGVGYGGFRIYSMSLMERSWYAQRATGVEDMFMPAYAHNEYLQVLADTGPVGLVLLLAIIISGYVMMVRVALRHPQTEWRWLALAATVAVTAFLFQNAVGVTLRQSGASMFFWLWLAIMAVGHSTLPEAADLKPAAPRLARREFRRSVPAAAGAALGAAGLLGLLCLLTIPPTAAATTLRAARALAARDDYRGSYAAARAAVEACPYSGLGYYTLAYDAGQLAVEQRELGKEDAARGLFQEAVEANTRALELSPGNASMYFNLGVSYRSLDRLDEAEKAFRQAVTLMPAPEHYVGLADVALARKQFDTAQGFVDKGLALDPNNAKLQEARATIERSRRGQGLTPDELRAAAQMRPDDLAVQQQYAGYLLRQQRFQEALVPARRWAELDPKSAEAQNAVGACYFNTRDYAAALPYFQRAIALKPSFLRARLNLAYSYGKLRQYQEATREVTTVAETGGDTPEGKEARAMLEKLKQPAPPAAGGQGPGTAP